MQTFEKQDPDVVARVWTSSPGRKRCLPDSDVVARALKFGVFVKKHPSHAAPAVAWAQPLSLGYKRSRPSAKVWGVCEKTLLPRRTRRRMGADVVARTHAFLPGHSVVARASTLSLGRRRLWSPDDAYVRPQAFSPASTPSVPEPHRV